MKVNATPFFFFCTYFPLNDCLKENYFFFFLPEDPPPKPFSITLMPYPATAKGRTTMAIGRIALTNATKRLPTANWITWGLKYARTSAAMAKVTVAARRVPKQNLPSHTNTLPNVSKFPPGNKLIKELHVLCYHITINLSSMLVKCTASVWSYF